MAKGKVKWFNDVKGFGIIEDVFGSELFVHYTSISIQGYKTLKEGEEVEFDVYEGHKGPLAKNVTAVS